MNEPNTSTAPASKRQFNRRVISVAHKRKIVSEADLAASTRGGVNKIALREKITHQQINRWRRQLRFSAPPTTRGRPPAARTETETDSPTNQPSNANDPARAILCAALKKTVRKIESGIEKQNRMLALFCSLSAQIERVNRRAQ